MWKLYDKTEWRLTIDGGTVAYIHLVGSKYQWYANGTTGTEGTWRAAANAAERAL